MGTQTGHTICTPLLQHTNTHGNPFPHPASFTTFEYHYPLDSLTWSWALVLRLPDSTAASHYSIQREPFTRIKSFFLLIGCAERTGKSSGCNPCSLHAFDRRSNSTWRENSYAICLSILFLRFQFMYQSFVYVCLSVVISRLKTWVALASSLSSFRSHYGQEMRGTD